MATVQRANVILQISDDADVIQKYKDKGYNIIDYNTGQILERAIPHETGALQALVMELQTTIDQKESEIKKLTEDSAKLKKELAKLKKAN